MRKDYINLRKYILRYLSVHFDYLTYKLIKKSASTKIGKFNLKGFNLKGIDLKGWLYFLKSKLNLKLKLKKKVISKAFFYKKLKWNLNAVLTQLNKNEYYSEYTENLCLLFWKNFGNYSDFNILYNNYNNIYFKKVKLYKMKVLNKIVNLKRFFFLINKI